MSNRDNDNSGAGQGSNKAALPINSKASFIDQSAVVYDVLSEGEIEGLVDGAYTIYLDGTPVLDNSRKDTFSAKRSGNVSYVASTGVITDNESANMFTGLSLSDGTRFIRIDGAAGTGNVNVAVNVATVTPSSSGGLTFANTMVSNNNTTLIDMQPKIRIAGAGQDGGVHTATITSFDSSAGTVEITPPPKTTVNNAATTVDLVDEVGGISGATATISPSGQGVNRSNVACTMSSPIISDSSAPLYNVDNFSYSLRTGHRNQEFVVSPEGIGQGAIGVAIGADLPSSSKAALGMGTESRIFANLDDHNRDTLTASSGTGESIAASQFGLADPGEIDQLKVTINHPRGLFNNDSEDGDSGNGWVELKIVFQYTRGSQTFTETVFGVDDMSTISREKHGTRPGANGFDGTVHNGIIMRKTQAQFATVFSFDTERFQPFDDFTIKVFKYTPDNYEVSNKLYYNQVQVGFVEAIIEDKLNYPYSAYAAVMIDSKDYTTVPKRSYEIRGIKCKVPTNYIPRDTLDENGNRTTVASYKRNITTGAVESSYQDWDGKFRGDRKEFTDPDDVNYNPVYTNNPAWVFYDILTNERYGLGTYLNVDGALDLVDRYQLFEVAKYCDELVPDGKGGTEPRFSCNVYISKTSEAIKVLKDLLTVFRGILLWHEGEISLNLQQEKAPIYTFTKGNVVDGLFAYSYSSKRVRANQVRVTWNDPDNSYKQAVELVEDSKNIAETGRIVSKATVAYGCTSEAQAHRVGKYHLLTETQDTEIVNFSSGIGGQILRPGDLIEVQDADRDNIQLSGRVSSGATTTVIPVDRSVALSSATNADLTLIYPNSGAYLAQPEATIGSTVFRQGDLILQAKNSSDSLYTITNGDAHVANARDDSGDKIALAWSEDVRIETKAISSYNTTHVVASSAFSSAPNEEVIFAITQTTATGEKLAGSPQTYMITAISEQEGKIFSISALKHTDGKYDEIDRGWTISTVPDVMRPPKATDGVPEPKNVSMRVERGQADNDGEQKTPNSNEQRFSPARLDLYWSKPDSIRQDDNGTSIQTPYEHLLHYEVSHNLYTETAERGKTTFDTIVVSPDKTTHTFDNIPKQGKYIIRIRTVATNGAKSPAIQRIITINPEKPAKQLEPKVRFGGFLTSPMSINSSSGLVSLSDSTYNMTPAESELQTYTVTSGSSAQTTQSFSGLADGNTGFMLHDFSDTTDPWKAIEYVRDTTGASTYRYAKQIGVDAFTQKTGTANTTIGSVVVDGTNTAFLTEYEAGDLFIFDSSSTRHISTINHIHSNTQLEMAHGAPATATGKNIFAQSLQPNFIKDTIIGEVANTSGTFTLINYASGNRGEDAYRISGTNENHTFPANSSGAISDFSGYTNAYTVKKGTVSYSFAASGTTLNTFGLSLATSNCTASLDGSGNITVSALSADTGTITVTVTDRGDGNATIDTRIITLTKAKAGSDGSDGSIGSDAKVVSLTASDSSIIYNAAGASPTPSTSTDITLTATAKNFTDPRMKFTGDGISDETSFTATGVSGGVKTFTFPVPASINTSPQTVQVEVQEGASGGTVALDTITIVSVKPGADGSDGADAITVNLTNESHTFPASAAGVVSSFAGSGTKIEVFKGATLLTPVANTATPSTNEYKVTTNSDTNISVGSYTLDTTGTDKGVTIGDHSGVANGTDLSEIEYSINVENSITLTKAQNFNKSKDGSDGSTGGTGPRSATGYIYYQSSSASSPTSGSAVSTSGVSFNFSTQLLSGGVIGTGSTNWNQIQPTFTGNNSNKYWYAYYAVTEATFGGTQTISFSIPYLGQNFTGLVTFTGANLGDGSSTYDPAGVINSGSTTIDGGKLTTNSIAANAMNVSTLSSIAANIGTVTSGTIKSADHAGTADGSDFSTDGTQINLSDGSISSKNFRIASDGSAAYKGTLTIGGTNLTTTNTLNTNTTANDVGLGSVDNDSTATIRSVGAATSGTVGGWTISSSAITGGTASGAANATFATSGGIMLGSAGFISANQFYVDTDGNANFKGTISGNDAVISGTLQTSNIQLGSFGANVSGTTIGSFNNNDLNYREIGTIGTGAGVYMGTIQAKGGDNHVKTIHFHVSDTTVNTSVTTQDTPPHAQSNTNGGFHQRVSANVDYLINESRLYGTESGNSSTNGLANRTFFTQPVVFKYEGTGTVKLYIYAQADGSDGKKVGHIDYRFIKLGTTDPQFSFSNLTGQALSTTLYANSQVTGGFSGTKTVSISGGSAQFKIDGGSFGTSPQQISNGSYINVQMTSSSSNQTTTSTTVTIGNTSSSWSITTGGTSGNGNGGDDDDDDGGGDEEESFVYGTNLTLSDGTTKKVEDIVVGDILKSFKDTNLDENATNPHLSWTADSLENASHGTCTVQGITISESSSFYIVNNRLHVTGTHYILVLRGSQYSWKQVKDLQPGDYMIKDGLTLEKIISVQPFTNNVDVYTFDTETADSYIAEGVVVYDSEI